MTDELTDAVRRLKELQADVERLKAGDDQRGVPRLLFSQSETAVASDVSTVAGADLTADETAVASDDQTDLRLQRTVETGRYDRTGVATSSLGFGDEFGRLAATASASLRESGLLAAVDATDVNTVGAQFDASVIVGVELVVAVGETTFVTDSFETDSLNITRRVPEATRVELRSTTTAPTEASVRLGTARPPQLDAESRFDLRDPGVVLEVDLLHYICHTREHRHRHKRERRQTSGSAPLMLHRSAHSPPRGQRHQNGRIASRIRHGRNIMKPW